MSNFPGNPYASPNLSIDGADGIQRAIMALAFEVRTANLQRQAEMVVAAEDFQTESANTAAMWLGLQEEVAGRMGVLADSRAEADGGSWGA